MAKKNYIIPVFVPHKGCPFDCVFCNQKRITGNKQDIDILAIKNHIKEYIDNIPDITNKHVEIAFFGGSFTGIDKELQRNLLKEAFSWKKRGLISDIRLSTRPDYINDEIMDFLIYYGVSIIELGVQSMNEKVLINSGRGHDSDHVKKAVEVMKKYPVKIGLQMMVGLPGDSYDTVYYTADELIKLTPNFVRIYPTLVVKDTELEDMYKNKDYNPFTLEETIKVCKELLIKFMKNHIEVIRIGLQPTENIAEGKDILAGPFHPSIRQLVEASLFKEYLDYIFKTFNINKIKKVDIETSDRGISLVAGHKRQNLNYLIEKYGIGQIKIYKNDSLEYGHINIKYDEKLIKYNLMQYINDAI